MKEKLAKLFGAIKDIPDKKRHLDFIAALLTIPVLLSVIILNYTNLSNIQKSKTDVNPTPVPTQAEKSIIYLPTNNNSQITQTPTATPSITNGACLKGIGPILITYPTENQTVADNPLSINIDYSNGNYCSVIWSFRINNGPWSDFTDNNPVIYNLPDGNIKFDLRVQSTVIQKEENLTRSFIYNGASVSPAPSTTSSANLQ